MRVLVIDDSALMRRIVGKALRETGLPLDEVIEAVNGVDGIATLERLADEGLGVDLILCDVHMPVMDGAGFLRERASRGLAAAPVVMVTADAGDPLVEVGIAAGAQSFIAKPFTAEQIREQLLSLVEIV